MSLLPAKPGPRSDVSAGDRQWRFNYPSGIRANTTALDPISYLWDVTLSEIFDLWEVFGTESMDHVDDDWAEGFMYDEFGDEEEEEPGAEDDDEFYEEQDEPNPGDPMGDNAEVAVELDTDEGDPYPDTKDTSNFAIQPGAMTLGPHGSYEGADDFIPTEEWMAQFWDMPRTANYSWARIFLLVAGTAAAITFTGFIRSMLRGDPLPRLDPGVDPEVGKKVLRKRRTPRAHHDAEGDELGVPAAAGGSSKKGDSANGPAYMAALRNARKAMGSRRFLLAERALRRLVRRMEDEEASLNYRVPAYRFLATSLVGQEKWEQAVETINDFLRLIRREGPVPPEAILPDLIKLCVCETNMSNLDEAEKLLKDIEEALPHATERQREESKMDILVVSSLILARTGKLDEAEGKARQAATLAAERHGDLSPLTWKLRTDYALILLDSGKPEQAEPIFDDVVHNVATFARAQKLPLLDRLSFVHRIATAELQRERYERAEHFLQRALFVLDSEPDILQTRLGKELQRMLWNDQAVVLREKFELHTAAGNAEKANACVGEASMLERKVQHGAYQDRTGTPLTISRVLHSLEAFIPVNERCASLTLALQTTRPRGRHPVFRIAAGSSLSVKIVDLASREADPAGDVVCETPLYPLVPPDFAAGKVVLKSQEITDVAEGHVLMAIVSVTGPDGKISAQHRQLIACSADSAQLRRAQAD